MKGKAPASRSPRSGRESEIDRDHYSYRLYADRSMAEQFDRARFGGAIGAMLAETQEQVLTSFLGELAGQSVLDVGTGTGRAALALAHKGASVTGIDASSEMLRVARERAQSLGLPAQFEVGDAHALGFPDAHFDASVSLRVLMHTPDWRRCIAEMCRVSRSRVVFDFPAAMSAAALQAAGRGLLGLVSKKVESYRVLRYADVQAAVEANGFRIVGRHRQFVLPIAFHKLVNSRGFTEGVERALASIGLLRVFGSPVTIVAERCASS